MGNVISHVGFPFYSRAHECFSYTFISAIYNINTLPVVRTCQYPKTRNRVEVCSFTKKNLYIKFNSSAFNLSTCHNLTAMSNFHIKITYIFQTTLEKEANIYNSVNRKYLDYVSDEITTQENFITS